MTGLWWPLGLQTLSTISDLFPEVGLLGRITVLFLTLRCLYTVPMWWHYHSSRQPCTQPPISLLPCSYLLSLDPFTTTIHVGVPLSVAAPPLAFPGWLVMLDTFHILVGICVSNLEKCLFKSLAHVKISLLLLLSCRSFLSALMIKPQGPFVMIQLPDFSYQLFVDQSPVSIIRGPSRASTVLSISADFCVWPTLNSQSLPHARSASSLPFIWAGQHQLPGCLLCIHF